MNLPMVFHQSVQDDFSDAYSYYVGKRAGLANDFLAAVEKVYHWITSNPFMYQKVFGDIRKGLTRRFPYSV